LNGKTINVTWQLRVLMAKRNVRSAAALARLLEEKAGYKINATHLTRYMKDIPPLLSIDLLNALLATLDAHISDLLVEEEVTLNRIPAPAVPTSDQPSLPEKPKRRGKKLPAEALPRPAEQQTPVTLNPPESIKRISGPKAELFPDIYHEDHNEK